MAKSREAIWKEPRVEYWTNDRIMKGLSIDRKDYRAIYAAFEVELDKYPRLGENINNITVKEEVLLASEEIQERFPDVFRGVDPSWLEECMIRWAQRINNNRKRRKVVVDRPVSDYIRVPDDANPRTGTRVPVAFGEVGIVCCRKKGGSVGIHPKQLVEGDIPKSWITPDHLRYDMFIQQLTNKIGFDPSRDSLWYRSPHVKGWQINESDLWQIALGEMHRRGLTPFNFYIEPRSKYKPRRSYSSSNAERIGKATTCRVDNPTACTGGDEVSNCVSEDSDLSSLSSRQFNSPGSETSINESNSDTRQRLRADSTTKKRKFRNDSIVAKRQKVRDD